MTSGHYKYFNFKPQKRVFSFSSQQSGSRIKFEKLTFRGNSKFSAEEKKRVAYIRTSRLESCGLVH